MCPSSIFALEKTIKLIIFGVSSKAYSVHHFVIPVLPFQLFMNRCYLTYDPTVVFVFFQPAKSFLGSSV